MRRILNLLRYFRPAPEVTDVMGRLYPESDRPHRAVPTRVYEPQINPADVSPFYVGRSK